MVPAEGSVMDARDQAEYVRLERALVNGPLRRMYRDSALGRWMARDDMEQASRYARLMLALSRT